MKRSHVLRTWSALLLLSCVAGCSGEAASEDDVANTGSELTEKLRVLVYGDSLVAESAGGVHLLIGDKVNLQVHSFGGTAICDWFDDMAKTVATFNPQAVVVSFSGNALTPCMKGYQAGTAAYFSKYAGDADRAMRLLSARGAAVYFAAQPKFRDSTYSTGINGVYLGLRTAWPKVRYTNGVDQLEWQGKYHDFMPCYYFEPCSNRSSLGDFNRVRNPDGIHFCPVIHPGGTDCPVYSSGAFRFAGSLTKQVVADYRL